MYQTTKSQPPTKNVVKKLAIDCKQNGVAQFKVRWYPYALEIDPSKFSYTSSRDTETVTNERRSAETEKDSSNPFGQMREQNYRQDVDLEILLLMDMITVDIINSVLHKKSYIFGEVMPELQTILQDGYKPTKRCTMAMPS